MLFLHIDEACKLVDRHPLVLRDWRLAGLVSARKRNGVWFFDRDSLIFARARMDENYRLRRIVPGAGRGRFKSRNQMGLWEE